MRIMLNERVIRKTLEEIVRYSRFCTITSIHSSIVNPQLNSKPKNIDK